MKDLKRILIYWGKISEKHFGKLLLTAVAITAMMKILYAEETGFIVQYVPMLLCVGLVTLAYWNIKLLIPQAISMGATRKECFAGMQIFYHLFLLQGLLIGALCMRFVSDIFQNSLQSMLLYYIAISCLACGLGNVLLALMLKSEGKIMQVVYVVTLVIVVCVASLVEVLCEYFLIPHFGTISIGVILVSVVLDIGMLIYCRRAIMQYEVRI